MAIQRPLACRQTFLDQTKCGTLKSNENKNVLNKKVFIPILSYFSGSSWSNDIMAIWPSTCTYGVIFPVQKHVSFLSKVWNKKDSTQKAFIRCSGSL